MPVAGVKRRRCPGDGGTDARPNMRIVIDVKIVIHIDEAIPRDRPKNGDRYHAEQEADKDVRPVSQSV